MPAPCLGNQLAPSSLVMADELTSGLASSSETKVRPVALSVNRIGSRLVMLVNGLPVLVHVDDGVVGQESSKPTRKTVLSERNIELPVSQVAPIDGSPASVPSPEASCAGEGVTTLKRGGSPLPSGAAGNGVRPTSRN